MVIGAKLAYGWERKACMWQATVMVLLASWGPQMKLRASLIT